MYKNQNKNIESIKRNYFWGSECIDVLFVGLAVSTTAIQYGQSLKLFYAIKNQSKKERTVTIQHDLDSSWRFWVHLFSRNSEKSLFKFYPNFQSDNSENKVSIISHQTIIIPQEQIIEFMEDEFRFASIVPRGKYRLQLLFGGPDFDFSCRSDFIPIEIF
ncbi:MAG: hypothetical protein ABUK01_08585 [Leptospirales bacterium]